MKSAIAIPAKIKITAIFLMILLPSFGLGYSVVKFVVSDQPNAAF